VTRVQRYRCEDDGATAVEFALVLPLLLSILFGIISFGQYFAIANSLQQFAAEAARYSVSEPFLADREGRATSFLTSPGGRFSFLNASHISADIDMIEGTMPAIQITLTYDLSGTAVEVADSFLNIGITDITRSSYLAY